MRLCDVNPFMRYAELQPSVISSATLGCSYDHRIFYILEGNADFVLFDRTVAIAAGTLICFRSGTPYYFDGKVKVIVLNFDMTRAHAEQKKPLSVVKSIERFDKTKVLEAEFPEELGNIVILENAFETENQMRDCLLHYGYPTSTSDAVTSATVKKLLCYIAQKATIKEEELPELVQRITLYIQQHYEKELGNSQISNEFGYHSYYLNRVFKKSTGITIHQAVIQERIRVAKKLLRATTLSIHSVAIETGFSDSAQFCAAFKKYTGYTPTEYRKKKTAV